MRPSVVCISRSLGAGGEAVGQKVAAALGLRYVDEEIVSRAADKVGVPVDLVADAETRKSLTRRVLEEVLAEMGGASMLTGVSPPRHDSRTSDDYRQLIQQAIEETAKQGGVLIVAHAASLALADREDVLRVLITGSPENRAKQLAGELELEDAQAKKLVKDGDLARQDYFKRFYGVRQEQPTHYDLVVNTDALGPERAATLVLAACNG